MNRQKLTGTLYSCFLTNPPIQSLQLKKLKNFNLFLQNIIKWLRVLRKKEK